MPVRGDGEGDRHAPDANLSYLCNCHELRNCRTMSRGGLTLRWEEGQMDHCRHVNLPQVSPAAEMSVPRMGWVRYRRTSMSSGPRVRTHGSIR